jgi:hypothetical protein
MEDGSDLEFEDHGDVKDEQEEEEDVVSWSHGGPAVFVSINIIYVCHEGQPAGVCNIAFRWVSEMSECQWGEMRNPLQ